MKTLVIGASGQVGGLLLAESKRRGDDVIGTSFEHGRPGLVALDARSRQAVTELVRSFRPDTIFFPAALSHVDYCQDHPDECRSINVGGPAHAAAALKEREGRLVFFSTEYVFRDSRTPYAEDDACCPVNNVYAQSKVEAEQIVRETLPDRHLVLRTSWVYGPEEQRKNFVYRVVRTLRQGQEMTVPQDQYGQPTYAPDLAAAAFDLALGRYAGTFHVVGPDHLHRLAFTEMIREVFALSTPIKGVPSDQLQQAAPRPKFIQLRRDKLLTCLGRDPIRAPRLGLIDLRDGEPARRP
jgi:dTDP-4-dehydrorhamnose reductase